MQLNKDILTKEKLNIEIELNTHSIPILSLNPFPLDKE